MPPGRWSGSPGPPDVSSRVSPRPPLTPPAFPSRVPKSDLQTLPPSPAAPSSPRVPVLPADRCSGCTSLSASGWPWAQIRGRTRWVEAWGRVSAGAPGGSSGDTKGVGAPGMVERTRAQWGGVLGPGSTTLEVKVKVWGEAHGPGISAPGVLALCQQRRLQPQNSCVLIQKSRRWAAGSHPDSEGRRCPSPRRPHPGWSGPSGSTSSPLHFRDDSAGGEIRAVLGSGANDAPFNKGADGPKNPVHAARGSSQSPLYTHKPRQKVG